MKKLFSNPHNFKSISEFHQVLRLPKPEHPLVSVVTGFKKDECFTEKKLHSFFFNFYCIVLTKDFDGKLKYGRKYYDFDEGVLSFFSPMQVISTDFVKNINTKKDERMTGYLLLIHPDFIRNYPLYKTIKNYGFFSYAVNEALHLSKNEETAITTILQNIQREYQSVIDNFSQDVIISYIELLLNYCNRFYNRQFITRRTASNDLLIKLEMLLNEYFDSSQLLDLGLPTVQYIAGKLNVSPSYLSDMLCNLTGQTTQQHIHNHLIEKAKEILVTTNRSVSEIAYQLGFEYPQSFSKLFKSKTKLTPLKFRQSFN